jgi:glycosyltransferase involved in cell wall biosynthesis
VSAASRQGDSKCGAMDPGDPDTSAGGTSSPVASIVMPAHNAERTIAEAVTALLSQAVTRPVEVLIVDNMSTDRTQEIARSLSDGMERVHVLTASGEQGAAYARNVGVARAKAPLLIFVDADDIVAPGWLTAYLSAASEECLLAGPIDELTLARFPTWSAASSPHRPPMTLRGQVYATTANCAISHSLFTRLGGFESGFGGDVGEDVDLSWRVEALGIRVQFVPDALVVKRPRQSRRELFSQWRSYAMSSSALHQRHPERVRSGAGQSAWCPSARDNAREMARCLRHPVDSQGVYIQLMALVVGRFLAGVTPRRQPSHRALGETGRERR